MKETNTQSLRGKWSALKLDRKFTAVILIFVIIPISILGVWLFTTQKNNVVSESVTYMQHTMERTKDNIDRNINSINIATQFFLNDESLQDVVESAYTGISLDTDELLNFYSSDVASLERLVNSNPALYAVREYSTTDNVQEMMPILYSYSRMKQQTWTERPNFYGWNYNYQDLLFEGKHSTQDKRLVGYMTQVKGYNGDTIGVIESVMTMESMFPSLYENVESEWSCFVTDDRNLYFDESREDNLRELAFREVQSHGEEGVVKAYSLHYEGRTLVVAKMYMKELGGTIFSVQDITDKIVQVNRIITIYTLALLALAGVLAIAIAWTVKRLLRKLYDILRVIHKVQDGDLDVRVKESGSDEMGELAEQVNTMLDRIGRLMQDNVNREILVKNSEIRALQNQINTHFIYNVLESIKMMAEIDEEYEISDAITSLGKLLRYSMKWVSGNVLVEQELEYIENYVALMNLRFDYVIQLAVSVPENMQKQRIPKMSLQPIIENAIIHGIEQIAEDTTITVKGFLDGDDCIIEITDAGRGMTEAELEILRRKLEGEIETSGGSGNGIGLKNVQDRIHIAFGERYGMTFASQYGCYTKVSVRIPMESSDPAVTNDLQ